MVFIIHWVMRLSKLDKVNKEKERWRRRKKEKENKIRFQHGIYFQPFSQIDNSKNIAKILKAMKSVIQIQSTPIKLLF